MPFSLLLAMQAAGMVTDWIGTRRQAQLGEMGAKIQQAGIEANIEQTRLETEDASLQAMINLRKNLGTQMVVNAARGVKSGQSNTFIAINESVGNFGKDERMRRMNLMAKENSLKAGGLISKLNQSGENTKLWTSFATRSLNTISSNPKSFGLTSIGS